MIQLNTVWVSCEGENPADVENIGPIEYYPRQGFPGYYYPYENSEGYLSPLVAIHFKQPMRKFPLVLWTWMQSRNSIFTLLSRRRNYHQRRMQSVGSQHKTRPKRSNRFRAFRINDRLIFNERFPHKLQIATKQKNNNLPEVCVKLFWHLPTRVTTNWIILISLFSPYKIVMYLISFVCCTQNV